MAFCYLLRRPWPRGGGVATMGAVVVVLTVAAAGHRRPPPSQPRPPRPRYYRNHGMLPLFRGRAPGPPLTLQLWVDKGSESVGGVQVDGLLSAVMEAR